MILASGRGEPSPKLGLEFSKLAWIFVFACGFRVWAFFFGGGGVKGVGFRAHGCLGYKLRLLPSCKNTPIKSGYASPRFMPNFGVLHHDPWRRPFANTVYHYALNPKPYKP